ncbi:MAG TPA: hypothetical protein VGZ90_19610 [Puia sp.]|nr:hypothetical protein [Puia sp.]
MFKQNTIQSRKWIDLSILNLSTVAFLGLILRSKILFALPFINYNHLLEAHSHFSFGGWVTLILVALFIHELLPESFSVRPVYQWLLGSIAICAWGMLVSYLVWGYSTISIITSLCFVLLSYIFGLIFIKDLLKAKLESSVELLAISSIVYLILSSSGLITITIIYFTKSFNAILYKDALYTYLHFQYNGFFTLAIFALLFNLIAEGTSAKAKRNIYRFSLTLCISIIPSLFLSYLWQDPNLWLRIIAMVGSILLIFSFYLFLVCALSLRDIFKEERGVIGFLVMLSMGSFMLKIFLQSFTIFPVIGNAIFGNRPIIMGFLHLVFLGFVTLFILAYFIKKGLLNSKIKWTGIAVIVFAIAVILNEVLLILQGMATMFIDGSSIFPWLLWITGILLFTGSLLLAIARIQTRRLL